MARIIPAQVHFDEQGDEPPKLVVGESGADLSDLITDRGIDIQEEPGDFMDDCTELGPDNHHSDQSQSPDLAREPESKPPNGFRTCMSDQLRRPPESERLSQPETRNRFRLAVRACIRRQSKIAGCPRHQIRESNLTAAVCAASRAL